MHGNAILMNREELYMRIFISPMEAWTLTISTWMIRKSRHTFWIWTIIWDGGYRHFEKENDRREFA